MITITLKIYLKLNIMEFLSNASENLTGYPVKQVLSETLVI